jgi:MFS family permease
VSEPVGRDTPEQPPFEAPRWREVLKHRGRLTVGLLLLETVTAVQLLIVITILPVVVRDLGGLRFYGWALSASPLAAMIALPATGKLADRRGPAAALTIVLGVFVAGAIVASTAPNMPLLIIGRFLQGWGLGAQYAVSMGAVAQTYPDAHRARIIALLTAAWVVPGVVGPPLGALIAVTVGWRYTFLVSLPFVVIAAVLVLPELRRTPVPAAGSQAADRGVGSVRLLLLAVGAGALLIALTDLQWWTAPVAVAGSALLIPALRGILPPGSLTARPGLPAAVAAAFLLSFVFFGVDGFVPLLVQRVRGQSILAAGFVVTLSAVSWTAGTWWQSKVVARRSPGSLITIGAALIVAGAGGVWLTVIPSVPLLVAYIAWTIGGLGIGIGFPTIPLVAMSQAEPGRETSVVASAALADTFGAALGPGLGGSAVALIAGTGSKLTVTDVSVGLSFAFGLAIAGGLLLFPVARRLPSDLTPARPAAEPSSPPGRKRPGRRRTRLR